MWCLSPRTGVRERGATRCCEGEVVRAVLVAGVSEVDVLEVVGAIVEVSDCSGWD